MAFPVQFPVNTADANVDILANAESSIVLTPVPIVTSLSNKLPSNAFASIVVTVFGIVKLTKFPFALKACALIVVTLAGIT